METSKAKTGTNNISKHLNKVPVAIKKI